MSKITYSDLVTKAKELVSVVQNDQSLMQSMFTSFSEWMEKIRPDSNVEVKIISRCTNDLSTINTTVNNIPLPGVINAVSVASNMNRKMSGIEIQRKRKRKHYGNQHIALNRQITHKRSRDCVLCNSKGHGKK